MKKILSNLFRTAKPLYWVLSLLIVFHIGMAQSVFPPLLGVADHISASDFGTSSHFGEEPRVLLTDGYRGDWGWGYGDYGFSEMPFMMQDFMLEFRDDMGHWFLPFLILLFLTTLVIGITTMLVGALLVIVFVYILVKIIQTIAAAEGSDPSTEVSPKIEGNVRREADIIGKYVYYLYLVSILFPITCFAGVIISYIHRGAASEWMRSHYRFLIRTFWIGLLYSVISGVLTIILIGLLGYALLFVWLIVRCVKGIRLHKQGQPIPDPGTWLW